MERRIIFIFVILTILNQECAGSPLERSVKDGNDQLNTTNKNQSCGGYLAATDTVKHFYSHARYGEDSYESRTNCDWSIVAPSGHFVKLAFLTFELEPAINCYFDFVQVFEGLEDSRDDYGKFCGAKMPPEIWSKSEALNVRFRTDESIVFKGFLASYQADKR